LVSQKTNWRTLIISKNLHKKSRAPVLTTYCCWEWAALAFARDEAYLRQSAGSPRIAGSGLETCPDQDNEAKINLTRTLFSACSVLQYARAGSSRYFFDRLQQIIGAKVESDVSSPQTPSKLHVAEGDDFRNIFFSLPSIGRYSALSNFGMVPAAVMGVDVLSF